MSWRAKYGHATSAADRARPPQISFKLLDAETVEMRGAVGPEMIRPLDATVVSVGVDDGVFHVPIGKYERALDLAKSKFGALLVDPVFPPTLRLVRSVAARAAVADDLESLLPPKMRLSAMAHQFEFWRKFFKSGGRMLLADEPGLGKTMQALGAACLSKAKKTLVVCPPVLLDQWVHETLTWTEMSATSFARTPTVDANVVVVAYDTLAGAPPLLWGTKWDFVVCDECHLLNGDETARTKALVFDPKSPLRTTQRRLLASATPIKAHAGQCWPLFCLLSNDFGVEMRPFTKRYANGREMPGYSGRRAWSVGGVSNAEELFVAFDVLKVRRKKAVSLRLPTKTHHLVYVELSPRGKRQVLAAEAERVRLARQINDPPSHVSKNKAMTMLESQKMECRRVCTRAKLRDVVPYVLESARAHPKNSVVFGELNVVYDTFAPACAAIGLATVKITGETAPNRKFFHAQSLAGSSTPKKLGLVSTRAAGVGLQFQPHVTRGYFVEADWSPWTNLQAEDRMHRIGTVEPVDFVYFVVKGTTDENVLEKNVDKTLVSLAVFDGDFTGETYVPKFATTKTLKPKGERWFSKGIDARWVHAEGIECRFGESREQFLTRVGKKVAWEDVRDAAALQKHEDPNPVVVPTEKWVNVLEEEVPRGFWEATSKKEGWVVPAEAWETPEKWAAVYVKF